MKLIPFFLFLLFLTAGCQSEEETEEITVPDHTCLKEEVKKSLSFHPVERKPVVDYIHLTGTIEVNPEKVVKFHSLVSGIISATYFSLGDYVEKGQLLAEMKSTELSSMQAEVRSIKARIRTAERNLESAEALYTDEMLTHKELEEARSELIILRADLDKTRANLSLYSASPEKDVFQIKAPASGVVTDKSINPGWQINDPEDPLFVISDLNEIWVLADIYASNVRHITRGMDVEITTMAYPEEVIPGKISQITQTVDPEDRVLKARIRLPNVKGHFRPGMLADIWAINPAEEELPAVPRASLVFYDDRHYVVVYRDDCDMEIREVSPGLENEQLTYIDQGLEEGETVISGNPLLIFDQIRHFKP